VNDFSRASKRPSPSWRQTPKLGIPCRFDAPRIQDLRWWRVKRFDKHLIFYRPADQGIEVVRILHSARNLEAIFPQ
jgi:toxin ParE1/3/4